MSSNSTVRLIELIAMRLTFVEARQLTRIPAVTPEA
jgi:hypothetical protein